MGWAAGALALGLLGGCFDGGGDEILQPPATNEIPDSALVSVEAYTKFALTNPTSETAEPLNVDKVISPPVSETVEPIDFD